MASTFVAFPLFFITGANKEDIVDFCSSAAVGVGWAWVFISVIGALAGAGISESLAMGVGVGVPTAALCAFHFIVTRRFVCTKVPMMFGAIACTFFAGADKWLPLVITLCLGVLLAYVCKLGTLVFKE
jgi:hypothetical protein